LICAVCCGENRRTVFSCPEDCVYLHSGESYRRQKSASEVRDKFQARYAGYLHSGRETLANDLFLLEGLLHRRAVTGGREEDGDILDALSFVRRSFSAVATVEQFPSPLGRDILAELKKAIKDDSPLRRDQLQEAVDELIRFLKSVSGCGAGDRAYVELLRVAAEPMGFGRDPRAEKQRPSGIILPGEE
jgi:hypothetical protein